MLDASGSAGVLSRGVGLRGFESHPPHQTGYPVSNCPGPGEDTPVRMAPQDRRIRRKHHHLKSQTPQRSVTKSRPLQPRSSQGSNSPSQRVRGSKGESRLRLRIPLQAQQHSILTTAIPESRAAPLHPSRKRDRPANRGNKSKMLGVSSSVEGNRGGTVIPWQSSAL